MNVKSLFLLFLFILLGAGMIFSQSFGIGYNANTGDANMDLALGKINVKAKANLKDFKAELKASYQADGAKVDLMITTGKMQPADVYMAFLLSDITKKPIDDVVKVYNGNKGKGWGVMAKELGIKPGSKEFHALKNSFKGKDKGKKDKSKGKGRGKSKGKKKK